VLAALDGDEPPLEIIEALEDLYFKSIDTSLERAEAPSHFVFDSIKALLGCLPQGEHSSKDRISIHH
jgi:hypothetical protein